MKPQPKPIDKQLSKSALRRKKREVSKAMNASANGNADRLPPVDDDDSGDADENDDFNLAPVIAPLDPNVCSEPEGHSIDSAAIPDENYSDSSAAAAESVYDLLNSSFHMDGLTVMKSLSGETSTESYHTSMGTESNSAPAQSWQLMDLLLGNEQPAQAPKTSSAYSTFNNRLDLGYSGYSSLLPSSTAQPSPPGEAAP